MGRIRNRYRNYLSVQALVILLVIITFKVVPDKKWASVLTSLLFISVPSAIAYWEARFEGYKRRPSYWGSVFFLVFSALPIFLMRLIFWDMPFDQIEVLGVTGTWMHQASNMVFMLMMVCYFVDSYLETTKARRELEERK